MSLAALARWSGPAAMLGGALWIASTILTALQPEGCIAAECELPGRSMREGTALGAVTFLAALLLIVVGVAGLVHRARTAGRFGRAGRVGLVLAGAGVAVIVLSSVIQAVVYGGDFPLMPLFVIPGGLAAIVGMLLVGIAVLRAGVVPRWVAALLIVGVLAMLGVNDQNARVLLAVPFGIAWLAVGYELWSGTGERRAPAPTSGAPLPPRPR